MKASEQRRAAAVKSAGPLGSSGILYPIIRKKHLSRHAFTPRKWAPNRGKPIKEPFSNTAVAGNIFYPFFLVKKAPMIAPIKISGPILTNSHSNE